MGFDSEDADGLYRETLLFHDGKLTSDQFTRLVYERRYSCRAISNVLARAWREAPLATAQTNREVLDAILRVRILEKHVDEQERIGRLATVIALIALAVSVASWISQGIRSQAAVPPDIAISFPGDRTR
jgi:hypothetical protein